MIWHGVIHHDTICCHDTIRQNMTPLNLPMDPIPHEEGEGRDVVAEGLTGAAI
jgi:hypothetical protein